MLKKKIDSLYAKVDVENYIFNKNCDLFTKNNKIPKLSDKEKEACDTNILEAEIRGSLKLLQNGKLPGSDGLTTEFYKFFWHDIKLSIVESIRYSIIKGELSVEQKPGIINLIPKKDKNRLFLKKTRDLYPSLMWIIKSWQNP